MTKEDTPIVYRSIEDMDDDEIDELVDELRQRRLQPVLVFQEHERVRKETAQDGLREALTKQCNMFKKEQERANAAIEKLEQRAARIRAIRIQLDEDFEI